MCTSVFRVNMGWNLISSNKHDTLLCLSVMKDHHSAPLAAVSCSGILLSDSVSHFFGSGWGLGHCSTFILILYSCSVAAAVLGFIVIDDPVWSKIQLWADSLTFDSSLHSFPWERSSGSCIVFPFSEVRHSDRKICKTTAVTQKCRCEHCSSSVTSWRVCL